jgi:hypothetical protein
MFMFNVEMRMYCAIVKRHEQGQELEPGEAELLDSFENRMYSIGEQQHYWDIVNAVVKHYKTSQLVFSV